MQSFRFIVKPTWFCCPFSCASQRRSVSKAVRANQQLLFGLNLPNTLTSLLKPLNESIAPDVPSNILCKKECIAVCFGPLDAQRHQIQ
jgi:hypothetical protein